MKTIFSTIILLLILSLTGCHSQHAADFASGAIYTGMDNYNYHGKGCNNFGNNGHHRPKAWEKGGIINPYNTTIQTNGGTVHISESVDYFGNRNVIVRDNRY